MKVLKGSPGLLAVVALLLATLPVTAMAHVKWFVSEDSPLIVVEPYKLTDPEVLIWICLSVLMISGSILLDSRLPSPPITGGKARSFLVSIIQVSTGASLLLIAFNDAVIAPHYLVDGPFSRILQAGEFMVGLCMILNIFTLHNAALLILLFAGSMIIYDPLTLMDYINVVGIALFLGLENLPKGKLREHLQSFSIPALRILTGSALIILGLSEKILNPHLGQAFLAEYQWNFIYNLGFTGFSDQLFVLSAGVVEVVFGLILIIGTTTRLNILVLAGFMITSNLTFVFQGNSQEAITEIIGHLPVIATAVLCVFFGSGQRLKFTNIEYLGRDVRQFYS